eukprot:149815_1
MSEFSIAFAQSFVWIMGLWNGLVWWYVIVFSKATHGQLTKAKRLNTNGVSTTGEILNKRLEIHFDEDGDETIYYSIDLRFSDSNMLCYDTHIVTKNVYNDLCVGEKATILYVENKAHCNALQKNNAIWRRRLC